jgi:hypothetical protein
VDEDQLVSLFQASDKANRLYRNEWYESGCTRMEFQITKIAVWKEFFCRYDESKSQMSN